MKGKRGHCMDHVKFMGLMTKKKISKTTLSFLVQPIAMAEDNSIDIIIVKIYM